MNIHFYNFIAAFNHASKTKKWTFSIPLRNKFVLTFIEFLLKEKLIDSYSIEGQLPYNFYNSAFAVFLPGKKSAKCVRIKLYLKHEIVSRIHSLSRPGELRFLTAKKLMNFSAGQSGTAAVVICSSSDFGRLCTAQELIAVGKGGMVLCAAHIN